MNSTDITTPDTLTEGQEVFVATAAGTIEGPFTAGLLFEDGNGNLTVTTSAPGHPTEWTPFDAIRVAA